MSKKDDEKYNNGPDDGLLTNNPPDDSDNDEFYYEPVEAEIYQMDPDGEEPPWYMAQKQRRLTPGELAEKKKKETEEVLAFVNGETDELLTDEEKERAEAEKKIVDFQAAADKKAEEKNQDGRIKNFIKSHVHDIIAYGIGVLIIVTAILAALKFRRYQEGIEADRAAHMPPPPTPMVVATTDDAGKATDGNTGKATPDDAGKATDGNAEKKGRKTKKKKTEKASPETAVTEFPETVPGGIVQPKNN